MSACRLYSTFIGESCQAKPRGVFKSDRLVHLGPSVNASGGETFSLIFSRLCQLTDLTLYTSHNTVRPRRVKPIFQHKKFPSQIYNTTHNHLWGPSEPLLSPSRSQAQASRAAKRSASPEDLRQRRFWLPKAPRCCGYWRGVRPEWADGNTTATVVVGSRIRYGLLSELQAKKFTLMLCQGIDL